MSYWFTADEHYGHANIIHYCNRPFKDVSEMNAEIIQRHNSVVLKDDVVYHIGDLCWYNREGAGEILSILNGNHVLIKGSHDNWLGGPYLREKRIDSIHIVMCHYPMRSWPRSHYNSIQLHGHVHCRGRAHRNQLDVGVDCWGYFPVSWEQIREAINENSKEIASAGPDTNLS